MTERAVGAHSPSPSPQAAGRGGPAARPATPARAWLRALETMARATRDPLRILPRAVAEWASRYGDATALISDRETFSFRALEARMNQYSRWALGAGVAKGETVALAMGNRPEYFAIWLGLTQVGAIVALVSADLPGPALAHALQVAEARRVIVDAKGAEAIAGIERPVELWTHGFELDGARRLDTIVAALSGEPLALEERREVTLADRALRIFTSGTTGLPKAAEVSHRRIVGWTHWFAGLADLTAADRLYDCLPMHHSVGGVVAIGAPLVNGGSVAIAERFSARRFWDDVERWDCTAFQYIGELCRYLVAAPPRPAERRTSCGSRSATDFPARSGAASSIVSGRCACSNSTPPPKATSGSTMSKAGSARSAASRPISRRASRSRWPASTPTRRRRPRARRLL